MTGVTIPSNLRDYQQKLDAWERKVAQWLGLPLHRVIRGGISVTGPDEKPDKLGRPARINFELAGNAEPTPPTRCWTSPYTRSMIGDADFSETIWRSAVQLNNDDANAFHDEIGPRPELLTPTQEQALQAAMAGTHGPGAAIALLRPLLTNIEQALATGQAGAFAAPSAWAETATTIRQAIAALE